MHVTRPKAIPRWRGAAGVVALITALGGAGRAAEEEPRPQEPAATRTITISALDEKGQPVEGLVKQEVVVLEDGAPREVTRLELDRRPLAMAIVVDSSAPIATHYRLTLMDALGDFVRLLPEGTRYTVWVTGDRPKRVVDLTDDRTQAGRALRKVFPTGGNTLLDALVEAAEDLGQREAERSVLVVVTGVGIGFANLSRQQVVETVGATSAVVMAVQFEETGSSEFQAAGPDQVSRVDYDYVLGRLSQDSGGLYERPLSAMGAPGALRKIASALAGRYRLSYQTDATRKGAKLTVQVARPDVKVRVMAGGAR